MTLPAFSVERRAAAPLLLGARRYRWISTARTLLLLWNDETDGPFHRP